MLRLWRIRWNLIRLLIAAFCLWTLGSDAASRAARLTLAQFPDADMLAEVRTLREEGKFDEAILVADAAIANNRGEQAKALIDERDAAQRERDSLWRKAKDAGRGAVTGSGDSLEALAGAIAADFFLVGDIRDLTIQGYRGVTGQETDELIILLSGVGVATTLAPEVDWAPSILKALRKLGAMSDNLAHTLLSWLRKGDKANLDRVFKDVDDLALRAGPGGAAALIKHADDPADIARMRAFAGARPHGAFTMYRTGREGVSLLRAAEGSATSTRRAANAVSLAAKKGPAARAFLGSKAGRVLIRPHPFVGVAKAFTKGNLADVVARAVERLDPTAWWLVPALAAWCAVEGFWLARRLFAKRAAPPSAAAATHTPAAPR